MKEWEAVAAGWDGRCATIGRVSMSVGVEERRARLGRRHHLARAAAEVETVAGDLVGLHSRDPATVFLSARARVGGFGIADLEDALYERRSLVRVLAMRRTMFVAPRDLAAVMHVAATQPLGPAERRRTLAMLDGVVDGDPDAWLDDLMERTERALAARGEATAAELAADVPDLALKISFGAGTRWAGTMAVSARVLQLLGIEGRVVRARPRGSWLSGQYRWARVADWLGGGLPARERGDAAVELARRWLRSYGPATEVDLAWWAKWTKRETREVLAAVEAVAVELDGAAGFVLPDDTGSEEPVGPWVALLPGLDPSVMGWKERDWFLGPHGAALFDRNGNAGPTVWVSGRIVGGWAQRPGGAVVARLLEPIGSEAEAMVEVEAERLTAWLDGVVVTPRFRSPLEREMAG